MPYDIKKEADGSYHVFNQVTHEDKGKSTTRGKAERHMAALYSAERDAARKHFTPGADAGGGMVLDSSYMPTAGDSYVDGKRVPRAPVPAPMPAMASGGTETLHKAGEPPITFHKGGLHESTGTPKGQKIPAKKRAKALAGGFGAKAEKQAQFAKNVLTG